MVCVGAVILICSSAQAQNPEILANNVGFPDNIIIDESSVYWGMHSLAASVPSARILPRPRHELLGGPWLREATSLRITFSSISSALPSCRALPFKEHDVFKTPKFGGFFTNAIAPDFALGGTLTIGPAGGILYYMGGWREIPPDPNFPCNYLFSPLVSLSTQGGDDNALIYNNSLGDCRSAFPTGQPQILAR